MIKVNPYSSSNQEAFGATERRTVARRLKSILNCAEPRKIGAWIQRVLRPSDSLPDEFSDFPELVERENARMPWNRFH